MVELSMKVDRKEPAVDRRHRPKEPTREEEKDAPCDITDLGANPDGRTTNDWIYAGIMPEDIFLAETFVVDG